MNDSEISKIIELVNRTSIRLDTQSLHQFCEETLVVVLQQPPGGSDAVLNQLNVLGVTFVNDSEMAQLHDKFSGIPGATDVLTFQHGEIVSSVDTAAANAVEYGIPFDQEIRRYIVHGLLHLHGYDDQSEHSQLQMQQVQEKIIEQLNNQQA